MYMKTHYGKYSEINLFAFLKGLIFQNFSYLLSLLIFLICILIRSFILLVFNYLNPRLP